MADLYDLGHARARSASRLSAANRANVSSEMSERPRDLANLTTRDQWNAGMPRSRQPLTVDLDCPRPSEATSVPPSPLITSFQVEIMLPNIVRTARTCQGVAICETTVRGIHGQIISMDTRDDIARRIIAVRERRQMNQVVFAAALNVAKNTMNGYEKGTRDLTLETAKRIHDRFGISIDWLLYGNVGQPGYEICAELGPRPRISSDAEHEAKTKKRKVAK